MNEWCKMEIASKVSYETRVISYNIEDSKNWTRLFSYYPTLFNYACLSL